MKISKLLAISLLGTMLLTTSPAHASTVNITINNIPVQFTEETGVPFIDSNNRTLVPMRLVMEQYGCQVSWNQSEQTATVFKDSIEVKVPINSSKIYVNGKEEINDTMAVVKDGKTYLPIKKVLESFGANVSWNNSSKSVIVSNQSNNGYQKIEVDGGDMSGNRQANVMVDIGFGDREYWAYTNEYGQLVRVTAKKITLQNDSIEPVKSNGRYYNDEAKVAGTERSDMDKGHVIADSLGGVSNAYNITPQNSTLNRHGNQAYMEKVIRDAGGCTDFEAIITYPNTSTQIPSHYHYTYTLKGNKVTDDFDNVNPDEVNKKIVEQPKPQTTSITPSNENHDISSIDKNGDGKVTIKEAKDAGFKMPITKSHWLYKYMDDRDGDGMVGE